MAGVVLAGGKSKRFGRDKRFFVFSDRFLVQIAVEKFVGLTSKTYIVVESRDVFIGKAKESGFIIPSDVGIISDLRNHRGPLYGIYSFFKKTREEIGVFVPVDMPYLPVVFLRYLVDLWCEERPHLIFISDEHPLPCVISRYLIGEISDYVRRRLSLRGFFAEIIESGSHRVITLNPSTLLTFGKPEVYLKNINTQDDLNETC